MGLEDFKKKGSGVGVSRIWNPKNKFEKKFAQEQKADAELDELYKLRINHEAEERARRKQTGEDILPPEDYD